MSRKDTAVGSLEGRVEQLENDMQFMKVKVYFSLRNLKQTAVLSFIANVILLIALAIAWWG